MKEDIMFSAQGGNEIITPKDLVWKHIKEPNHVITDDELKKLTVGNTPAEKMLIPAYR